MRVVTEVAALDRAFDYAVPHTMPMPGNGDRVRVDLHGRSVRAWVESSVESDRDLKFVTKWLGLGPPPELLSLATWAGERWFAPRSRFLLAMSPDRNITVLPTAPAMSPLTTDVASAMSVAPPGVVRLAPTVDPLSIILTAYAAASAAHRPLLVLMPTDAWAERVVGRLAQRGLSVARDHEWDKVRAGWPVVVGSRGAAFAPLSHLGAAVIIDADDDAFRSEASPTWHARDVVVERCRRDAAPWWMTSPVPSPVLLSCGPEWHDAEEARGWPLIDVADRRHSDPRDGVLSATTLTLAHTALDSDSPVAVAVILQRLGRGRLFACVRCGDLARCAECGAPEAEDGDDVVCPHGHGRRTAFCRSCGATKLRRVQSGVTTLARDVAAQLSCEVTEVTAATPPETPLHRVVVGTEAILQRVRRCALVVFVDFDQYLLAPRERARRDAVLAVARAGRLVGARTDGRGRVVLQTRRGEDVVLSALSRIDFSALLAEESETAEILSLPPFGALCEVEGEAAAAFLDTMTTTDVVVSTTDKGFVLHADTPQTIAAALRSGTRPPGRLRVAMS